MHKKMIAVIVTGAICLTSCAANRERSGVAKGASVGSAGGAIVGALAPGVGIIEGAAIGAGIGGLTGAIWADNNNDGYADGYIMDGAYHAGTPPKYDATTRSVLTGAGVGGTAGAITGALTPNLGIFEGAVLGSLIGGFAGAIWADDDGDGVVDGYVQNGKYHKGVPPGYTPPKK